MWRSNLKSAWSQLLAGSATLLGLGALFGGGAQADTPHLPLFKTLPEPSRPAASRVDEVMIRIIGESVQISQDGSSFEELRLGDSPQAAHLRKLLREAAPVGQPISVPIGSIIVASGGGGNKGERPKESGGK